MYNQHKAKMYDRKDSVINGLETEDQRRVVECRVQFIKFCKIDIIGEQFRAKVVFKAKWKEYDLIRNYDPNVHWNPRLFVENCKSLPTNNIIEKVRYTTELFSNYTQITEIREMTGISISIN